MIPFRVRSVLPLARRYRACSLVAAGFAANKLITGPALAESVQPRVVTTEGDPNAPSLPCWETHIAASTSPARVVALSIVGFRNNSAPLNARIQYTVGTLNGSTWEWSQRGIVDDPTNPATKCCT